MKNRMVAVAVGVACVLGVSSGAVFASSLNSSGHSATKQVTSDPFDAPVTKTWKRNAYGLTVGTPSFQDTRLNNLPQLVPAVTDSGEDGFIIASQVYFPPPKTPKEAVAQTKKLLNDKGQLIVTVYAADGRTVIGTQHVADVTEGDPSALP